MTVHSFYERQHMLQRVYTIFRPSVDQSKTVELGGHAIFTTQ